MGPTDLNGHGIFILYLPNLSGPALNMSRNGPHLISRALHSIFPIPRTCPRSCIEILNCRTGHPIYDHSYSILAGIRTCLLLNIGSIYQGRVWVAFRVPIIPYLILLSMLIKPIGTVRRDPTSRNALIYVSGSRTHVYTLH